MRTIAVTGGIGSGKSVVCSILSARGIPVYDSDSAAKRLYKEDDELLDSVEGAFGQSFRTQGGEPDLKKLASVVFSSPEKLSALESIVHPAVMKDFRRWKAMWSVKLEDMPSGPDFFGGEPFCVMESAIILQKPEFLAVVDKVALVDAPLQSRLKRACERDNVDPSEVIKRMAAQRFDLSKADAIIRNDGTLDDLQLEVSRVFKELNAR
ncbi:MAG: dephospho-CoA kinase [Bacteroidales bacterium]|nr:dephospho-CoA kinase [Bacteroidales bacterium]